MKFQILGAALVAAALLAPARAQERAPLEAFAALPAGELAESRSTVDLSRCPAFVADVKPSASTTSTAAHRSVSSPFLTTPG